MMADAALTRARSLPSDDAPQVAAPDVDGRQDFGDRPTEMRESDHYVAEYVTSFVEKWDELIDWKHRAQSEGAFLVLVAIFFVSGADAQFFREELRLRCGR